MTRLRRILATVAAALLLPVAAASGAPLIAVDPGHGGGDTGAVGTLPPGTPTGLPTRIDPATGETKIYEKDVNLDVGNRVNAYLQARGYPTVMTRTQDLAGGDRPYTTEGADLQARVAVAQAAHADLFVSLHENALGATTTGTETYHFYYANQGSRTLALLIHQRLIAGLGLPDRGVQSAGFYVLRKTTMPAVLVEGAFLTNPNEALLLADPTFRQRIADAVGGGIVAYAEAGYVGLYAQAPPIDTSPKYQVNAGTYRRLRDAKSRYRMVRRKGFSATIRSEYNLQFKRYMFVVVGGKFVLLQNAQQLRTKMRSKGLRANVKPLNTRSRPVKL